MTNGNEALILSDEDLLKLEPHVRAQYVRRNENIRKDRKLCDGCAGTGNVTYAKYTRCEKCDGKGHLD